MILRSLRTGLKSAWLLVVLLPLYANPVMIFYFSELWVDPLNPENWMIELHCSEAFDSDLTGWKLISNTDTSFIKPGILLGSNQYLVLTPDSLLTLFAINRHGDVIELHDSDGPFDGLRFGDVEHPLISAPRRSQSMSFGKEFGVHWYLDNSPTFGSPNDALNAKGSVHGTVTNAAGQALANVAVGQNAYWGTSNELGEYSLESFAARVPFSFYLSGFETADTICQVWPDSSLRLDITLSPLVGIDPHTAPRIATTLVLEQNFPNPFNPSTSISYELSDHAHVTLRIHDTMGREVVTLQEMERPAGRYEVQWSGTDEVGRRVNSGIYFARLKAGDDEVSIKMVYLR